MVAILIGMPCFLSQPFFFFYIKMTRATEAYTFAAIAIVSYIILFLGFVPLPETVQDKVIPVVCLNPH